MTLTSRGLVDSGIQAAFANNGVWTAKAGSLSGDQVIAALIGDSITNSNTSASTDAAQDSWGYGMFRNWQIPVAGWLTPTTDPNTWLAWAAPSSAVTTGTNDDRGYNDAVGNPPSVVNDSDPLGVHGLSNYGLKSTREFSFTANVASSQRINQARLNDGEGDWWDSDWYNGEGYDMHGGFVLLGATGFVDEVTIRTTNSALNVINTTTTGIASAGGFTIAAGGVQNLEAGKFYRCDMLTSANAYAESGEYLVHVGAYLRLPSKPGWQLLPCGVGGSKFTDWNVGTGLLSDTNWTSLFNSTSGVMKPNLFIIALGANGFVDVTLTQIIDMVDRCHSANPDCRILLIASYGTANSITQEAALRHGNLMLALARDGTTKVARDRIACLNTPRIMGAAAEAGDLVDNIHPKRTWVNEVTTAWWTEQGTATEPPYRLLRHRRMRGGRFMVRAKN